MKLEKRYLNISDWAESYWVPMTQFRILKRERNKTLSRWRTTIGSSIDSLINA